ncbi:uncharacterized protein bcl3 isoform X1 [Paramormyrops kingsleyae]|uniref:uncharacterized protein bcl3 isoform X1 n=2 Tax=Paramormyrops kingsleyae TaxID=1676925 RepID=UPI003B9763C6
MLLTFAPAQIIRGRIKSGDNISETATMTMNGSQPQVMPAPLDLTIKDRDRKCRLEDGLSGPEGDAARHTDSKQTVKINQTDSKPLARGHACNDADYSSSVPGESPCTEQTRVVIYHFVNRHTLPDPPSDSCRSSSGEYSVKSEAEPSEVNAMDNDPKSSNAQPVSRLPLRKRPFPAPDNKKEAPAKRTKIIANLQNDPQQGSPPPSAASSEHPDKMPSDSRHTLADLAPPCRPNRMDCCQLVNLPLAPFPLLPVERMEPSQVTMATWQDDDGDTALHIAVVQGLESLVRRLIQILLQAGKGLDIYNNLLQTPLHLAVITHQALLVQLLLSAGADPTMLDRHGQTAAHLCCEHGLSSCLGLLLRHPASQTCLKVRNYEGLTMLHLAVQNSNKELVKMILDSGADINAVDFKSGRSPLIHAVENNSMEMINFLIESGSNVNMQSYSGNTALHSACGRGQVEAVRVLLKNGADSSLKNYHNDTALMVAKNKKVTDVLRGKGSRNQTTKTAEPSDSISPPRCTPQSHPHSTNGTPVQSPSQSLCPSPLATPTQLAPSLSRNNPGSPIAPPSHSPGTQSVEDHSGSQPMMAKQESKDQHLQCTQPSMTVNCETTPRMHVQPRLYLPADCATYQSYFRDSTLGPIIPYPVYHNILQTVCPEQAYIFLPHGFSHQLNYAQPPCYHPVQSRPSSRSSDQSDASTMSISSGGKGES